MNQFNPPLLCKCCRRRRDFIGDESASPAAVIEVVNVLSSTIAAGGQTTASDPPQAQPDIKKRLRPNSAPRLSSTQDIAMTAPLPAQAASTGETQSFSEAKAFSPPPRDLAGGELIAAPLPRSPDTIVSEMIPSNPPIVTSAPDAVAADAAPTVIVVAENATIGETPMQPSDVEVSPSVSETYIVQAAPIRRSTPAPMPQSPPRQRSVHTRPENHGRHLRSAIDDARTLAGLPPRNSPRK